MRPTAPFFLLALAGCSAATPAPRPPVVETLAVGATGSADAAIQLTGTVHAPVETDLGFRVPGIVVARLVDRGTRVRRGQVIARIDPSDYRSSAATADASAAAAQRDAAAAESAAATAVIEERRLRGLDTAGAIAPLTYERARNQAATAADQARAARARAAAAGAQASLAGDQTSYTLLRAPMDGVVADVMIEQGQVVQAGTPAIRLAGGGGREAEVFLPETMLAVARRSAGAVLYDGGGSVPVRLREISAVADPVTRTYRARYVLTGAGAAASLGSTVTVALASDGATGGVALPLGAIVKRGGPAIVYVVDRRSRRVAPRRIAVVSMGSETATVRGDLRPGDLVVRLGGFLLKPGDLVRLSPDTKAPS